MKNRLNIFRALQKNGFRTCTFIQNVVFRVCPLWYDLGLTLIIVKTQVKWRKMAKQTWSFISTFKPTSRLCVVQHASDLAKRSSVTWYLPRHSCGLELEWFGEVVFGTVCQCSGWNWWIMYVWNWCGPPRWHPMSVTFRGASSSYQRNKIKQETERFEDVGAFDAP